jgi:D-glycero-alpha-D-manno-heptose 1-phosphate guanylyltransferase
MFSVILLCGGLGTRLQELHPGIPKPLIPVAGRPFVEWAIQYWARQGAQRVIVSLGHLAAIAEAHFELRIYDGVRVETVREPCAMGTGGAARFAAEAASSGDPFFVANGDSLVLADVSPALRLIQDPCVDAVVLGVTIKDSGRYGSLDVEGDGRLRAFREKEERSGGLINAGIYLFRRRALDLFPAKTPLSLETEVFPALLERGSRIVVHSCLAPFLDMGTPEGLNQMGEFIETHFRLGKR